MKRAIILLLILLAVLGMTACGTEKAVVSPPDTQPETTPVTTAPTIAETAAETTAPVPAKILEPFLWEPERNTSPSSMQGVSCTLEVTDDAAVKVNLYKNVLFAQEDVKGLQLDEELELSIDNQLYAATVVNIQNGDEEKGIPFAVQMSCEGRDLWLTPAMDGDRGEGELIGYLPVFPPKTFIKACYESHTLTADSFVYQEKAGDGEMKTLTGSELIQRLKEQPEAFHLENTNAWLRNGNVVAIYANLDIS